MIRTTSVDPAFIALTRALDADLYDRYGPIQDQYAPFNLLRTDTAVVAYDGELPVGCACMKPFDAEAPEVKRMFVAPSHRRAGVGRALIAELEAWARELGYAAMVLETGNRQPEAVALYERCGFARVPLFGPYVGLDYSICMRKDLG